MIDNQPQSPLLPSEMQLKDIINFLPDATFVIDGQKRVVVWNHAMEELTGVPSAQILGKADHEYSLPFYGCRRPILIDLVTSDDTLIRQQYPDFSRSRDSIIAEAYVHALPKGGAYLWAVAKPLYDADGRMIGAIESLRDITERKQAEQTIRSQKKELETVNTELAGAIQKLQKANVEYKEANERLRESEEKFATAFRLSPVVVTLSTVAEGRYVEVSDSFYAVSGYTREEVIGRTSFDLNLWMNPEDRNRVLAKLKQDGRVLNEEILFRDKGGNSHAIYFSAEFLTIRNTPYLLTLNVDITERKHSQEMIQKQKEEKDKLEKQLHQAQKMESIGRLAGGIAHDFNNLLTAIMGNTHLVMMNSEADGLVRQKLGVVMKAAESAAGLTKQLLAFSRRQVIEPRSMDLNFIVKQMSKMLGTLIGEDVRLKTVLSSTGKIKADPGQIEQILINLAVNARDAMPDGGKLILETADVILDEYYCKRHPHAQPGSYVSLAVSDTGTGMTEEVKKNLFEPFFTTKPKGKGTGLGLATVYGAVKQNNGCIEVYSVLDKGTSFKIYFPQAASAEQAQKEKAMEVVPQGNETILFVEDDALVRDFALSALERLGYHVLSADSGEEALAVAAAHPGPIDLLLTDVILAGINGKVLAEKLTQSRPGTKVLFTSGYTGNVIAHHGVLDEGIQFIEKPYSIHALSRKIREVIQKPE